MPQEATMVCDKSMAASGSASMTTSVVNFSAASCNGTEAQRQKAKAVRCAMDPLDESYSASPVHHILAAAQSIQPASESAIAAEISSSGARQRVQ